MYLNFDLADVAVVAVVVPTVVPMVVTVVSVPVVVSPVVVSVSLVSSVVVSVVSVSVVSPVVSVPLVSVGAAIWLHAVAASMQSSKIKLMIRFIPVPTLFLFILLILSAQITVKLKKSLVQYSYIDKEVFCMQDFKLNEDTGTANNDTSELYSLIKVGLDDINTGNTRPFSEAISDIRNLHLK